MKQREMRSALDRLYGDYNREDSASDPVHLVRPYAAAADREIAGFCAAALAFGRVASVLNSIDHAVPDHGAASGGLRAHLRSVRAAPRAAGHGASLDPRRGHRRAAVGAAADGRGIWLHRAVLRRRPRPARRGHRRRPSIVSRRRAIAFDVRPVYGRLSKRPGVCYFFPRPSAGSACKRLNLYLRWMVRRDEIDLGAWASVSPAQLIVPLDTHVIRLGRCLRLTKYVSPGWRMAADITRALRTLDPEDPVRFDFALCHVGMMGACGDGRPQGNSQCPLKGQCRPRTTRSAR